MDNVYIGVGCGTYNDPYFRALQYPDDDIERGAECAKLLGFAPNCIHKLTLKEASAKGEARFFPTLENFTNLIERLKKFYSQTGRQIETLWIHLIMHGYLLKQRGGERYFCFQETKRDDLNGTALSFTMLKGLAESLQAVNTILSPDACQKGLSHLGDGDDGLIQASAQEFSGALRPRNVSAPRQNVPLVNCTWTEFSPCSADQFSYEDDQLGAGVFTYFFEESLRESLNLGIVTFGILATQTRAKIASHPKYQNLCNPTYRNEGGDVIFKLPRRSGETATRPDPSFGAHSVPPTPTQPAKTTAQLLQEAKETLDAKIDPESIEIMDDAEKALEQADAALQLADAQVKAYDYRSKTLLKDLKTRCQLAKAHLDKVKQGWKACYEEGDHAKALSLAESVLVEEPDHVAALELKNFTWTSGKLAEGESLFAQGKLDEALAVANAILEREPGNQSAFNLKKRVKEKQASDRKRQEDEKKKQEEEERRKRALNWLGSTPGEQRSIQIKGVECKFSFIPKGSFMMGSPSSEAERCDDETQHRVRLSQDFWLGSYPVTQELYKAVTGANPSAFKGARRPVERVSWFESRDFAGKLNSMGLAPSGWRFDLPTEAQWEYSCRAGTSTPYNFGSQLNGYKANCDGNYPYGTKKKGDYLKRTTDVGSYAPNAWNLFDMHGNVWEWLLDWYGAYPENSVTDPTGPATDSDRVLRGGGWNAHAKNCRSAYRNCYAPSFRFSYYGFRLALVRK